MIEILGKSNIQIDKIVIDSKAVSPGTLFVALKGSAKDGHDYIDEAIKKGASAVLLQGSPPKTSSAHKSAVTFIQVSDTREALTHLVPYFFDYPADQLNLIGVTGTNGKTTTTYLINTLLNQAGRKTGLLSTIAFHLGKDRLKATHTTPGLLELQEYFLEMRKNGLTHVAMEVSSHALHQGRVDGCQFETAVFTNLTQDHLDYHGSMSSYFLAKKSLFQQTQGKWIINTDDPFGRQLQQEAPHKVWSYGIQEEADLYPLTFKSTLAGIDMLAMTPIGEIEIRSQLVGRHNVYNILAAIGVAASEGLSKDEISSGIAALQHVPGRFEKIDCGQKFTVIVDYAHTPDALEALLCATSKLKKNRLLTLFGCGGDRDRGKRPQMGQTAAAYSDHVILTSDNPRTEAPLAIIKEIEMGLLSYQKKQESAVDYECISDRLEAIERIIHLAQDGDIVVIAGKGHESHQQIGDHFLAFDDREVARQALEK